MYLFVLCKSIIGTKFIEKEETKMNFRDATERIDAPITQLTDFLLFIIITFLLFLLFIILVSVTLVSNARGGIFTKAQTREVLVKIAKCDLSWRSSKKLERMEVGGTCRWPLDPTPAQ